MVVGSCRPLHFTMDYYFQIVPPKSDLDLWVWQIVCTTISPSSASKKTEGVEASCHIGRTSFYPYICVRTCLLCNERFLGSQTAHGNERTPHAKILSIDLECVAEVSR